MTADPNAAAAEPPPRRPHINVATIGHHGHGKTTLAAAITRVIARSPGNPQQRALAVGDLARGSIPRGPDDTITVQFASAGYATPYRRYAHVDVPGRREWLKNVAVGTAAIDAAVLVVSAVDAARAQTREHVVVAREAGAGRVVVFVNKCDAVTDPAWLDEVEREVREILVESGLPGDESVFVRGSALRAYEGDPAWQDGVRALLSVLDTEVPAPPRDETGPPLAAIDHVVRLRPQAVVTARVLRGEIAEGSVLELAGLGLPPRRVRVVKIEEFFQRVPAARVGQLVGIELEPRKPGDWTLTRRTLRRGQTLAAEGSVTHAAGFACELQFLATTEGGRRTPVLDGHRGQFYLGTADVTGRITLAAGVAMMRPRERGTVEVTLEKPAYVVPGMRFTFRDGSDGFQRTRSDPVTWGGTAARGVVTAVKADEEQAPTTA